MNAANMICKPKTCTTGFTTAKRCIWFGPYNTNHKTSHDKSSHNYRKYHSLNKHFDYVSNKHGHRFVQHKAKTKPKARRPATHYETLGLTSKATPAQIKSAYYRLSKKYHPDVNQSDDAQQKFTNISSAYEVLGNPSNRRHYDRGTYNHFSGSSVRTTRADMGHADYTRNRGNFTGRKAPPTGKTQHFDFDEFYRQHYGEAISKQTTNMKKEVDQIVLEEKLKAQRLARLRNVYIIMVAFSVIGFLIKKKL